MEDGTEQYDFFASLRAYSFAKTWVSLWTSDLYKFQSKFSVLILFDRSSFDRQKIGKYGDHTLSFSILIAESKFGSVSTLMELNGTVIAPWCHGESIPDYVQE